jgi:hypothetical protein
MLCCDVILRDPADRARRRPSRSRAHRQSNACHYFPRHHDIRVYSALRELDSMANFAGTLVQCAWHLDHGAYRNGVWFILPVGRALPFASTVTFSFRLGLFETLCASSRTGNFQTTTRGLVNGDDQRQTLSMSTSHTNRSTALNVLLMLMICVPIAFLATVLLSPIWGWFGSAVGIEAVGHYRPSQWCFFLVYVILCTGSLTAQRHLAIKAGNERS